MTKNILYLLILYLLPACSSKQQEQSEPAPQKEDKTELPVLDLASVIDKQMPDTFTWNSLAKNIRLVPISTNSRTLMGISRELIYWGDNFYIAAEFQTQTIYKIDKDGTILKAFRHVGNGPGEYVYLSRIDYSPQDSLIQVFDNGNKKWIFYNTDGKLIKEISFSESEISYPLLFKEDYVICRGTSEAPNQLYITDKNLNILQRLCPFDTSWTIREKAVTILQTSRCKNRDILLFNHATSDSVFSVTDKGLIPQFILNKGKNTIPADEVKKFLELLQQGSPYILQLNIYSLPGYYLISYARNKQGIEEIWSKSDNRLVSRFFNTKEEVGIPFILPSGKKIRIADYSLYTNGNRIALFIPAEDLVGEIEGVKEDDNPVLLLIET
ncbi:6-bladed beta-propeller [Parabacteroides sp. AF48-14]|uniref:6-bladed beta-propeller n=1 Tax=Parabacteroides sp. AF48-14 TaxID=2292052 RepID=UPI001314BF3D|nr:6-bladed beta-propeller [Parabacteroides sp. AF48-14]